MSFERTHLCDKSIKLVELVSYLDRNIIIEHRFSMFMRIKPQLRGGFKA